MHTSKQYKVIIWIDLLVLKVKIHMTKREKAMIFWKDVSSFLVKRCCYV